MHGFPLRYLQPLDHALPREHSRARCLQAGVAFAIDFGEMTGKLLPKLDLPPSRRDPLIASILARAQHACCSKLKITQQELPGA